MNNKPKIFFQKHNRNSYSLAITLFCVVMLCTITIIFTDSLNMTRQHQRMLSYGSWHGVAYNVTVGSNSTLTNNYMVESYGYMTVIGDILNSESISCGTIGYADSSLISIGNIELLDGHFPNNKNEIAMEASMLIQLGYSYELGQTIDLSLLRQNEQGDYYNTNASYTLCGVVRNYSTNWKHDNHLYISGFTFPDADNSFTNTHSHLFIKLQDKYSKYANDLVAASSYEFVLNDYTYLNYSKYNSEKVDYNFLQYTILSVGLAIIILLINTEITKKQADFVTLRVLGATKTTLINIFLRENIIMFLLSIIMGTLSGILLSSCSLSIIRSIINSPVVLSVDPIHIMTTVLINLAGMCLAFVFGFIRIFQIPLRGKNDQQNVQPKHMPHKPINSRTIFNRFHSFDRKKRLLSSIMSFMTISLITIMLYQTYQVFTDYIYYLKAYPADYEYGFLFLPTPPIAKESKSTINTIKNSYGVSTVQTFQVSDYKNIVFEHGCDETYADIIHNQLTDLYEQVYSDNTGSTYYNDFSLEQKTGGPLTGISDNLFSVYFSCAESDLSLEALSDNEIIIYLPDCYTITNGETVIADWWYGYKNDFNGTVSEKNIKVGDTVELTNNGKKHTLKIVGIIRRINENLPICYNITRPYTMLCNQATYADIFDENDYCYVLVNHGKNTIAYQTDAELSKIKSNLGFTNIRVNKETYQQNLFIQILLTVIISFAGIFITIIARAGIQIVTNKYELHRYKTLYQLGMPINVINSKLSKNAIFESLWSCMIAFVFSLIWLFIRYTTEYKRNMLETNSTYNLNTYIKLINMYLPTVNWGFIVLILFILLLINTLLLMIYSLGVTKQIKRRTIS